MTDRPASEEPTTAYVAVGSNIEPKRNIAAALRLLQNETGVRVTGISTFYCSAALDRPEQGDYLNGVWRIETARPAREIRFQVLRSIEDRLGRQRTADKWAPRTIDLDLVLYGQTALDEPGLRLPSPDIDRPFVALPLVELDAALVRPGTERPLIVGATDALAAGLAPDMDFTRHLRETLSNE